jgi:hypothetical protein
VLDLVVRDGFATPAEVAAALDCWPHTGWHAYGDHKRVSVPGVMLPAPLASLLFRMAALGAAGVPDLGLWGAGLHEMPPSTVGLGWHTDAERHPLLGFGRVRSGVVYLCGDGDLEFRAGARVAPAPGRLVMFDGAAPHRVAAPVTTLRRSVSLFWYGGPVPGGAVRATFEGPQ